MMPDDHLPTCPARESGAPFAPLLKEHKGCHCTCHASRAPLSLAHECCTCPDDVFGGGA